MLPPTRGFELLVILIVESLEVEAYSFVEDKVVVVFEDTSIIVEFV